MLETWKICLSIFIDWEAEVVQATFCGMLRTNLFSGYVVKFEENILIKII